MTLVILAAGMGSRFGGLKQITPIDENGNFIIDYSIYDAIQNGFDKVVFVIKKENYEIFKETIGKRIEKKIKVEYVFQELEKLPEGITIPEGRVKPWGTAHAVLCAKDKIDTNFAIINADDFYDRDAYKVISEFMKNNSGNKYAMAGYLVGNTLTENGAVKRGVCTVKDGYLSGMIESSVETINGEIIATPLAGGDSMKLDFDSPVSMNMFAFTPYLFDYLEKSFVKFFNDNKDNLLSCEYSIPDVVFSQIKDNDATVKVLSTTAVWQGVTYKEDKEKVVLGIKKLVDDGLYPNDLWK